MCLHRREAGRICWGMEGSRDMEWKGCLCKWGISRAGYVTKNGINGRKERDRQEENPKPKKRQMLHSPQCSTSNTNKDERREGGVAVGWRAVQCKNCPDWVVVHYPKKKKKKSSSSFWWPILSQSALPILDHYKSCKNNTNYLSERLFFLAVRWKGCREMKDKTKSIKASSHKGFMSTWFFRFVFLITKGFILDYPEAPS